MTFLFKVFLKIWHQEHLNHELDKVIKKVVTCQKIVRGFLCRRRLLHLLESVQQQQRQLASEQKAQPTLSNPQNISDKMTKMDTTTANNTNYKSVDFATEQVAAPSYGNPEYQNVNVPHNTTKKTDEYQNMAKSRPLHSEVDYQNITNKNTKTNSKAFTRQAPEEKIATLKNQIEKQMKAYVKQEDYEEMLKLVKVRRFFANHFS